MKILFSLFPPKKAGQWPVAITSVLNRKNGFAQRAKLAQKLRWRKATKSNFCDKVFIGFEKHVMLLFSLFELFLYKLLYNALLFFVFKKFFFFFNYASKALFLYIKILKFFLIYTLYVIQSFK